MLIAFSLRVAESTTQSPGLLWLAFMSFLQSQCGCLKQSDFLEALHCYRCPVSVLWSQRRVTGLPLAKGACFNGSKSLSLSELTSGPGDRSGPFYRAFVSYTFLLLFLLRNRAGCSLFPHVPEMCMWLKQCISNSMNYTNISGWHKVNPGSSNQGPHLFIFPSELSRVISVVCVWFMSLHEWIYLVPFLKLH